MMAGESRYNKTIQSQGVVMATINVIVGDIEHGAWAVGGGITMLKATHGKGKR